MLTTKKRWHMQCTGVYGNRNETHNEDITLCEETWENLCAKIWETVPSIEGNMLNVTFCTHDRNVSAFVWRTSSNNQSHLLQPITRKKDAVKLLLRLRHLLRMHGCVHSRAYGYDV